MNECLKSLPVRVGHGAPTTPLDPGTEFPLYYDLDSRELYAWQGSWVRMKVPPHWMGARYEALLEEDDWVSIGRGGDYHVASLGTVIAFVASALQLNDLLDVNAPAPTPGQALMNDGTQWVAGKPPRSLVSLEDVGAGSVTDGNELVFQGGQWVPGQAPLNINDLTDVTILAPGKGDVLRHDGGWKNEPLTMRLEELDNVLLTAPAAGQALTYDGTKWVNGDLAPQFEVVACTYCAGEGEGRTLLMDDTGERGQLTDNGAPVTDGKDYLICPDAGALWAKCVEDDTYPYRRIHADLGELLHMVMVLVEATSPSDLLARYPDFPVGGYWLRQVDGDRAEVMWYKAPDCHVVAPFAPRLVLNPGCGIWGRADPEPHFLRRLQVHATQICVDACPSGPVNAAMDMQAAVCSLVGGGGALSGQVGPCSTAVVITAPMSYQDAVCALDQAIYNLEQDLAAIDPSITACPSGPVNTATTVKDAICTLSSYLAGRVILPLPAGKVTVSACPTGVVNADTDAQSAICQLSTAVASPVVSPEKITVAACPTGFSGGTAQDALCQLAALQAGNFPTVVAHSKVPNTSLNPSPSVPSLIEFDNIQSYNGGSATLQYDATNRWFLPQGNGAWLAIVSAGVQAGAAADFFFALHRVTTGSFGTGIQVRVPIIRGTAPDGSAQTHYSGMIATVFPVLPMTNPTRFYVSASMNPYDAATNEYSVTVTFLKIG